MITHGAALNRWRLVLGKSAEAAIPLTISGVVRPAGDSQHTAISTAVGYTALLTEELIQHTDESPVVKAQEADPAVNVLNGLEFQPKDDGEKAQEAREYLGNLGVSEKAGFYQLMLYYAQQERSAQAASEGQAEAAAGAAGASAAGMAAGQLDEGALRALPLADARACLMEVRGVGPKVADCTLLYGLGRWDAYPVDVWMRRAGQALFTRRVKDPAAYLNRKTGGCAGIAQQYIFAWARSTGLTEKIYKNPACD